MRGVAHQHHRRDAVVVDPAFADDARELDPLGRAAQVRGVRHQLVAVEVLREQPLAEGDGLFLLHLVEAGLQPHVFGCLDDEGGGVIVVAVGVRLEPAVLGFFEREREGLEQLVRAEPDEAAAPHVDVRLVRCRVLGTDAAVEPVAGDDEVGVDVRRVVLHVGLEHQLDAQLLAACLQDVEQALAADAAEAVATRAHLVAADVHLDVVPVVEGVEDLRRGVRVGSLQVAERLVGEHDAPAEGVVGPVALDHGDVVRRVLALHQKREIQAGRAAADADDLHERSDNVVV